MLQLRDDVRARFYIIANLTMAGAFHVRYLGTALPDRATGVRWFTLTIAFFRHIHAV